MLINTRDRIIDGKVTTLDDYEKEILESNKTLKNN
jgi:hypothetical protein